ncbi:MAG: glucose-6-phosphate dehydrogenase [Candidatus Acidiferrales bacterium]
MTTQVITEQLPHARAGYTDQPADPCIIVMFGASGDLVKRKLLPALYDLAAHGFLAAKFRLIGFARTAMSDDQFRKTCEEALRSSAEVQPLDPKQAEEFIKRMHYCSGDYGDPETYKRLLARMEELDAAEQLGGNRLYYLSTPPEVYPKAIEQIGKAGLAKPKSDHSWTRIIVEKPFGRTLDTAKTLNRQVHEVFDESQVYRIDHYLGKETVQNILVFRFGNGIFEPLWNRSHIKHVQITAGETLGVEKRGGFYETAGCLRDMIQSHVMQLASLTAIEPPATFEANAVRNEKLKVLQSIHPFTAEKVHTNAVRGQYGPGNVGGVAVPAYRSETGVKPDSGTETYAAVKLEIENWRWAGVPFYLRSGKRLATRTTEIAIQFREAPHMVFRGKSFCPNWLVLNIQPDEGISLSFGAKPPGTTLDISPVRMDFLYKTTFGVSTRSAYATLIYDTMRGDATLFDRGDSVEAAWGLIDPILQAWASTRPTNFPNYASGTWGPSESEEMLWRDGNRWRT